MGFLNRNKNEVAAADGVNSQEELCPENVMEEMTETEITAESAPESSPVTLPDELPEQEAPKLQTMKISNPGKLSRLRRTRFSKGLTNLTGEILESMITRGCRVSLRRYPALKLLTIFSVKPD